MEYSYSFLFFWYTGLLIVAYILSSRKFSPSVAFIGMWLGSLALIVLGKLSPAYDLGDITPSAYRFLRNAGIFLVAGASIIEVLRALLRTRNRRSSTGFLHQRFGYADLRRLRVFSIAAFLLTAAYVAEERPNLGAYLHSGGEVRDKYAGPGAEQGSMLSMLATYVAMIAIPAVLAYVVSKRRWAWWMILPLTAVLVLAVLNIGKFTIIFLVLTGLNTIFYHASAHGISKKDRKFISFAALSILGIFWLTSLLRGSLETNVQNNRATALVDVVFNYTTGYIPAFSLYFNEYESGLVTTNPTNPDYDEDFHRFGNQTFAGFYRLFALLHLTTHSASNHYEGAFNVYTIHRDLIADFGIHGAYIALGLWGMFAQGLFRFLDLRKNRSLVILALATNVMEFSLVYSLFGFIFYPLCVVASPLLINDRPFYPSRTLPNPKTKSQVIKSETT